MRNYPKQIKKLIHEYLTKAYERELQRELMVLAESFAAWQQGTISSGELSHRIHRYEVGPSRKLYQQYNDGPADMNVAYAIVVGILSKDEVPPELLTALERPLSFYESLDARGELNQPDEPE